MHELLFEDADRFQVVEETFGEMLVGGEVLGGEDDGVAGEAVAERVERRSLFAGFGLGASGVSGIRAIALGVQAARWFVDRNHGAGGSGF